MPQWFHFRVGNCRGTPLICKLVNAGKATFPDGWEGYNTCASYDRHHWFRCVHTPNHAVNELV